MVFKWLRNDNSVTSESINLKMFGIAAVVTSSTTIIAMLWITTLTQSAAAQNTSSGEPDKTIEWKKYNSTILGLSIDYRTI
jgi:hypothetical protein